MEILAGLIKLDKPHRLPAPWFNRPALGLVTNTAVRIGVLRNDRRRDVPPDIVITPLKTDRISCTASLTVDFHERPGVVNSVLEIIGQKLNIGLLESVTVDRRARHRITMQLEPIDINSEDIAGERTRVSRIIEDIKKEIRRADGFYHINDDNFPSSDFEFEEEDTGVVSFGEVEVTSIVEHVNSNFKNRLSGEYDFSRVVVSSSTEGRYIRYTFPRLGAFEATISHNDRSGALKQITRAISDLDYNVLMYRLSRSNSLKRARPGKSIFVAVCEPNKAEADDGRDYQRQVADRIRKRLAEAEPGYQLKLSGGSVSLGATMASAAYPDTTAMIPTMKQIHAQPEIAQYFPRYIGPGRKIFVSYRSVLSSDGHGRHLKAAIFEAIDEAGCIAYDGFAQPEKLVRNEPGDVRARMWHCAAGIFIAYDAEEKGNLSPNQLIEWGYNFGQGKPYACISQVGAERDLAEFMMPNSSCITFDKFSSRGSDSNAVISRLKEDVKDQIKRWFGDVGGA